MTAEAALSLVPKMPDMMEQISPVLVDAQALQVVTKDDVELARGKGKIINALISQVDATFKPIKQAHDAAKKVILEQEKKHLAPLQEAKGILSGKIQEWDNVERNRIEAEQRAIAQEQERVRQLALEQARKKLDRLTENLSSDQERLTILQSRLTDPIISDEEAEVVRSQMRTIQTRISTTVERAQEVEQKVEEVSQPVAPVQVAATVKTATGIFQEKVITAINTKVLLRYLASDDCPFDASQFVDWKEGALKKQIQSANLAGVSWKYQARTKF